MKEKIWARHMLKRDLEEVLKIERSSFDCPWSGEYFASYLSDQRVVGIIAESGSGMAGFMVYRFCSNRFEILNLAVKHSFRRKGVASQMMCWLKEKLGQKNRRYITAKVRESNLAAQLFFKTAGFRAVSVLPRYYDSEDAYCMQFRTPVEIATMAK